VTPDGSAAELKLASLGTPLMEIVMVSRGSNGVSLMPSATLPSSYGGY
jgi:hypothetical protein